ASEGLEMATERCGYGTDTAKFQAALKSACSEMNVDIDGLADLVDDEPLITRSELLGLEVAPDTPSQL
ncbi:MAG: hypothetical protein WBG38_13385, partial [Nodosilinea sp.]